MDAMSILRTTGGNNISLDSDDDDEIGPERAKTSYRSESSNFNGHSKNPPKRQRVTNSRVRNASVTVSNDAEVSSESSEESSDDDIQDTAVLSDGSWTTTTNIFDEKGHKYEGGATYFRWNNVCNVLDADENKEPWAYWRLMFPYSSVPRILRATNENLNVDERIDEHDFWKYIGIRIAFILQPVPFGMKDGAYGTTEDEKTTFECGNYGSKFKMSRNRFFFIDEKLQFCTFTAEEKRQVSFSALTYGFIYDDALNRMNG